jgi:hypothetical protein
MARATNGAANQPVRVKNNEVLPPAAWDTAVKIFIRDQEHRLADFVPEYRQLSLSYSATIGFREQVARAPVHLGAPVLELDRCNFDFLFDYAVFPAHILVFAAEWDKAGRRMQPGDVIVQQAFLPPWPVSLKCIFGVRVLETFTSSTRAGFRYGTLMGHAEQGESAFYFKRSDGKFEAVVHTHSRPGLLASRLAAPVFTHRYQQYCAGQALLRMQWGFYAANPSFYPGRG